VRPSACIPVIGGGKGKGKGANGKGNMAVVDGGLDADSSDEGKGRSSEPKTEKSGQSFAMGNAGYSQSEYRISPRHSNRHQFYYYGQDQLVSTRGVGHGGRPSAAPTRSPLAECVVPESQSQPDKMVKPPSDARGPKLVHGPVIKLPKPETDDRGPKLQKAPASAESGKGKGKGRPNPYKTSPTVVVAPAMEPNRTYTKVKSHPPLNTKVLKKAPSSRGKGVVVGQEMPSPPKPSQDAGWLPSRMPMLDQAVPGHAGTPRPIDKGKGATDKSGPVLTRPPIATGSTFGVIGEPSEPKVKDPKMKKDEDDVGFGIVDGDNSDYGNPEEEEQSDQSTVPGKMAKMGGRRTLRKLEQ
jgi:hypothetical protein